MKRTATIGLRVDPEVKQAAENAALDDHRSVASLIEKLLVKHLIESGYLNGRLPASIRMSSHREESYNQKLVTE